MSDMGFTAHQHKKAISQRKLYDQLFSGKIGRYQLWHKQKEPSFHAPRQLEINQEDSFCEGSVTLWGGRVVRWCWVNF